MATVLKIIGDHRFSDGAWEEKTWYAVVGATSAPSTITSTTTVGDTTMTLSNQLVPSTTWLPEEITFGELRPETISTILTFTSLTFATLPTVATLTIAPTSIILTAPPSSSSSRFPSRSVLPSSSFSTSTASEGNMVGLGLGLGIPLICLFCVLVVLALLYYRVTRKIRRDIEYTDAVPKQITTAAAAEIPMVTIHDYPSVQSAPTPRDPPPYSRESHSELP